MNSISMTRRDVMSLAVSATAAAAVLAVDQPTMAPAGKQRQKELQRLGVATHRR